MTKRIIGVVGMLVVLASVMAQPRQGYPITPVPFTAVKVAPNSFWGQRLEASRQVTIPLAFSKCEETGRYTNFSNAAAHLQNPDKTFPISGFSFDDTDPYKTIEGGSYLLQSYPDMMLAIGDRRVLLREYMDSVIRVIASAQEPDGYLYTARTQNPQRPHDWAGKTRWVKEEELSHELYNLGHLVEAAVAHYQATGSRLFLDVAIRYADCVCREVGPHEGQACVVPGHQIAEMALAKLYMATGDKRYLDEAKFFLDFRGRTTITHEYSQAHRPLVDQDEAVGHAVRAGYMYAGMADVAALTGDTAYIHAIDRIWENIVGKKLYITGGVGATNEGEAFGKNYELPNLTAYCETCAAIANVYFNLRLFLLHGEAKYYDVLERTLYNGLLSGVSIDGGSFFYPNPLACRGGYHRQPWFGCACCPSNICRFIPSLPGYVYAINEQRHAESVYVNLFVEGKAELNLRGRQVVLNQQTGYPFDGEVTITVDQCDAASFAMKVRLPGWLRGEPVPSNLYEYADEERPNYSVTVISGKKTYPAKLTADGYLTIKRKWKKGDRIELHFDMLPRTVRANDLVEADRGMVAVERGPLVYCAEESDNLIDMSAVEVDEQPEFTLGETEVCGIKLNTLSVSSLANARVSKPSPSRSDMTLIPYFAWCHRGAGSMRVWLNSKRTNNQIREMNMQSTENGLLNVRKVHVDGPVEAGQVAALMKENNIVWHRLGQSPWAESYPYRPQVQFAIAHTGSEILVAWDVEEQCVRAEAETDGGRVWEDSCCELFVQPEGSDNYYNIECNCAGKLLVQGGVAGTERPLGDAELMAKVKRLSSLGSNPFPLEQRAEGYHWQLSVVVPVEALFFDRVTDLSGQRLRGNLYKCGDLLAQPHYLSFFPIDLPKPAFHCPQFFGTLVFE